MGTLIIWLISLCGFALAFISLQYSAQAEYNSFAAVTLAVTLVEFSLLQPLLPWLVNGLKHYIKPAWLANRMSEVAFQLACTGLLFLIDLAIDFKHLQFGTLTSIFLGVLATFAGSALLTNIVTGVFQAGNHRKNP